MIKTPHVAADVIIRYQGGIVLIERKNEPAGWAIPGGFVEFGESVEQAAVREAREETSLDVVLTELFHVYSKPGRDPRFQTVSVVFIGTGTGTLKGMDDARRADVFRADNLPAQLAFDHRKILEEYYRYVSTGERPSLRD
jgi:8-oxo-dGTP diphosphatase